MPRARILKPGFFANERLAEIPAFGRLLFAGLWTLADREGRLPDRARWIKGALFPYENVPVERLLIQLAAGGFIQRYSVENERFIQVVNFLRHQTPHMREVPSTIPAPDEHSAGTSPAPDEHHTETAFSGTSPSVRARDPVSDPVSGNPVLSDPVTVPDPVAEAEAASRTPVLTECRRVCREVFGSLSAVTEKVESAIQRFGPECVSHSVKEAVLSGGSSWKYAEKVMVRHEEEGCDEAGLTRTDRLAMSTR